MGCAIPIENRRGLPDEVGFELKDARWNRSSFDKLMDY
jgi:hypothetical protein